MVGLAFWLSLQNQKITMVYFYFLVKYQSMENLKLTLGHFVLADITKPTQKTVRYYNTLLFIYFNF